MYSTILLLFQSGLFLLGHLYRLSYCGSAMFIFPCFLVIFGLSSPLCLVLLYQECDFSWVSWLTFLYWVYYLQAVKEAEASSCIESSRSACSIYQHDNLWWHRASKLLLFDFYIYFLFSLASREIGTNPTKAALNRVREVTNYLTDIPFAIYRMQDVHPFDISCFTL